MWADEAVDNQPSHVNWYIAHPKYPQWTAPTGPTAPSSRVHTAASPMDCLPEIRRAGRMSIYVANVACTYDLPTNTYMFVRPHPQWDNKVIACATPVKNGELSVPWRPGFDPRIVCHPCMLHTLTETYQLTSSLIEDIPPVVPNPTHPEWVALSAYPILPPLDLIYDYPNFAFRLILPEPPRQAADYTRGTDPCADPCETALQPGVIHEKSE